MMFQLRSHGCRALAVLFLAALCVGGAAVTNAAPQAGGDKKMEGPDSVQPFQGNWDVSQVTLSGAAIPDEILKDVKVTFKGNQLALILDGALRECHHQGRR